MVVAGVRTDGRILRQTTVARFTAPTDRPPAVRALRLLRSGRTVRATWAGGTPKDGWVVRSVTTTGRVQTQPVTRRRLTLPDLPAAAGVRVTVTPAGEAGVQGRPVAGGCCAAGAARLSGAEPDPATRSLAACGVTRRGSRVTVRWRPGTEPVRRWSVTLRDVRGHRTTVIRPRTARSVVLPLRATWRRPRHGHRGPPRRPGARRHDQIGQGRVGRAHLRRADVRA